MHPSAGTGRIDNTIHISRNTITEDGERDTPSPTPCHHTALGPMATLVAEGALDDHCAGGAEAGTDDPSRAEVVHVEHHVFHHLFGRLVRNHDGFRRDFRIRDLSVLLQIHLGQLFPDVQVLCEDILGDRNDLVPLHVLIPTPQLGLTALHTGGDGDDDQPDDQHQDGLADGLAPLQKVHGDLHQIKHPWFI